LSTTLTVIVNGSGFTTGSQAIWALNGDTTLAVTKIKTNSTAFVSSTRLSANITIDNTAALDLYDIVVITPLGKKGIGIELFAVTPQFVDLGIGDGSWSTAINESGQIVGWTVFAGGGFFWDNGSYQILASPAPYTGNQPDDINDSGVVVGLMSGTGLPTKAFSWTAAGGMQVVPGTLGGTTSEAHAINNIGDIAGASSTASGGSHAALWKNGTVIDLQLPNFSTGGSIAWGINEADVAVGQYWPVQGQGLSYPFRWTAATGMELLSSLDGVAMRVNGAGVIVGGFTNSSGSQHAFRWSSGVFQDLGTLGGPQSMAIAINDAGTIVGRAQASGGRRSGPILPFIWKPATGMRAISIPPGKQGGQAWAINENEWVAGFANTASGPQRATLWKQK
jgi:probable HAF family extracellular repeat protein